MGFGRKKADVMVVSRMHNSESYQRQVEEALADAGITADRVYFTAALKCRNFEDSTSNTQVKQCKEYLDAEIAKIKPKWILAFGNEALFALTSHSGITKYRTKILQSKMGPPVIATVSPAAVNRNPGQKAAWMADVRFFAAQVHGKSGTLDLPGVAFITTKTQFEGLKRLLANSDLLCYDVETTPAGEFAPGAAIISLSGTSVLKNGKVVVWAMPLCHPQSPFRKNWRIALKQLKPYLEHIRKLVAHNGKFDARWLRWAGVMIRVTFDTMLACHLLDENRLKGLKPQVTSRFGVADWGMDTKNLMAEPIYDVLKYNALDTYYTYHLYLEVRQELMKEPRLLRIFQLLLMPASEILTEAERKGVWIDREKLSTAIHVAEKMRQKIEDDLMEFVPDPEDCEGWPCKGKTSRKMDVNFNPSNFCRWWIFEYLGLPVVERGKPKEDAEGNELPGAPSLREAVMLELKGKHPAIQLMLDRVEWNKYCTAFLPAYDELADENDRIHTTYKLAGTVTGRLSSGKEDADKIGARVDRRGINLQQVPRNTFIRGLFGAAPGFTIVEVDFSQVELRVVAYLSRDRRMLHLYRTNQDIHLATASWVMGVPSSQVTKEDRKKAKAINFGFAYGMGPWKFTVTAFEKYELVFSIDEAKAIRAAFFDQFRGLLPWHNRQRRIVNQFGRVQSPIGRIRHLHDIFSADEAVRREAERQAINSPVQSFASDMNTFGMIETSKKLKAMDVEGYPLGTIHDATLWEIRTEQVGQALPVIKHTYENLPLKKKFGCNIDVPIVADIQVGSHWGESQELSEWEIYNYDEIPF